MVSLAGFLGRDSFPTLELREIYGAIYYFLENTEEVISVGR